MHREKGKESLRETVKRLDKRLWHQLEEIWRLAEEGIQDEQQSKDGHQQGTPHCRAVEENLAALIPDDWKGTRLTATDLFILSAAAALHDAGKASDSPNDHGHVSMWEVRSRAATFGLDEGQAEVVGWIVRAHNDGDLEALSAEPVPLGSAEVDLRPLAALFKLADALHTDYRRVSRQVVEFGGRRAEHSPKTRFRLRVRGWRFDAQGRIELYAVPKDWDDVPVIHIGFEKTRRELEPVVPTLKDAGLPWALTLRLEETDLERKARLEVEAEQRVERAFVGMDYFTEADAPRFKGRGDDAQALWRRVMAMPLTLLVGNSGVGKTSLIRAGLFPCLHQARWRTAYTRPFDDPDRFVVRHLWRDLLEGEPPPDMTIVEVLARGCRAVGACKLLVVLDQFEDVTGAPLPEMLDGLRRALVAVQAGRFRNLRLLVSYRADAEAALGPLFQEVAGSDRGLPRTYLQPLSRAGALAALDAGFDEAQVAVSDPLLDTIADDLESQTPTSGVYPPYLQMVGETLCRAAREENEFILTGKLYRSKGDCKVIIGQYLFQRLAEFGEWEEAARRVLVAMVRSTGVKGQRSLKELQSETRLDVEILTRLLAGLVDRRMVRRLGGEQYEIVHDYLAWLVDQEITADEERHLKELREFLDLRTRAYATHHILLQPVDMARLYAVREHIFPNENQMRLLVHSCLLDQGPAWFWLQDVQRSKVLSFLQNAMVSPIPSLRRNAMPIIAQVAGQKSILDLEKMLIDEDNEVRRMAIWALARVAGQEAIPDLRRMLSDEDPAVRWTATEAIAQLGKQEAIPDLREMLEDGNERMQELAMTTLAQVAGREAIPDLWGIVNSKNDEGLRMTAVRLLSLVVEQGDIFSDLKRLLEENQKDWLNGWAARQVLPHVVERKDLPVLQEMLKSEDEYVQEVAAELLILIAEREDLPALRKMLKSKDEIIRWAAAEALGKIAEPEDIPDVRKMLKDKDEYVRWGAAKAFTRYAGRGDIPDLKEMLKEKDCDIRKAAIQALARVVGQEAIPDIQKMLNDKDRNVRCTAGRVLLEVAQQMGYKAVPVLREVLESEDSDTRWTAAEMLAQAAGHHAIPDLREIIKEADPFRGIEVKQRLPQVLQQMGREAVPDLLALLKDENSFVQEATIQALVHVAEKEDIADWQDLIKVGYRPVGSEILEALGKFITEDDLTRLAEWVARHVVVEGGGAMIVRGTGHSLLIHLDRKLYCPFELEWIKLPLFPPRRSEFLTSADLPG